jgi:hypothetical protein
MRIYRRLKSARDFCVEKKPLAKIAVWVDDFVANH